LVARSRKWAVQIFWTWAAQSEHCSRWNATAVEMAAVAAVIVGPYACADVTTDESEAHSGAIDVDATTLDAGASDPVAFVASVRIAAAVVATEKC